MDHVFHCRVVFPERRSDAFADRNCARRLSRRLGTSLARSERRRRSRLRSRLPTDGLVPRSRGCSASNAPAQSKMAVILRAMIVPLPANSSRPRDHPFIFSSRKNSSSMSNDLSTGRVMTGAAAALFFETPKAGAYIFGSWNGMLPGPFRSSVHGGLDESAPTDLLRDSSCAIGARAAACHDHGEVEPRAGILDHPAGHHDQYGANRC